jgi:exosortase family protein XrtF
MKQYQPILRFIGLFGLFYLLFFLIYQGIIQNYTGLDFSLNTHLANTSAWFLNLFGFNAQPYITDTEATVKLVGTLGNGVWIGDHCNGINLFALFAIFVLAFPSKNYKTKSIYILSGIAILHLANILRVCVLTWMEKEYPEYLTFNHNYTFLIIMYGLIFALWYHFVIKYSGIISTDEPA